MRVEIGRMLKGRGFLLSVLAAAAGIALGTSYPEREGLLEAGSFLKLVETALESRTALFLLPIAAVLPWSDSFLEEWKGGFLKASLPRLGRRAYVESKVSAVALGGFLSWILAGGLMLLIYFILFFPLEAKGEIPAANIWPLWQKLVRAGLIGGILSSLGGTFGVLFGSVYMAYGLPFVAYYFCMILHERYFDEALWLYPPEWILGSAQWGENGEGLWLFLLLFFAAAMGIHGGILYGKLEEI